MEDRLTEDERIRLEMENILRRQADPDRPSPLVEQWEYFEERDRAVRRALGERE